MKTCKEIGWKVGDKFECVTANAFNVGDMVTLWFDDATSCVQWKKDYEQAHWDYMENFRPYTEQNTGGSTEYYKLHITNPTTMSEEYDCECNDIIEALGMSFAEGNIFKALWRRAAARKGVFKQGYDEGKYDAEKIVFFANRLLLQGT